MRALSAITEMFQLHNRIESLWWQQSSPPLLLRAIEPVYAAISRHQLQRRAAAPQSAPLPLISVGNITVGGSGKTPLVLWLAEALKAQGRAPVILCRGDGGNSDTPRIISEESSVSQSGDEAKMLAEAAGCPVIAGRDRIAGSRLAAELGDVIILDDGFQYRHLARYCDIVLIPAEGVGNGHLIPAGPLREPLAALARADLIVRTGRKTQLQQCAPLSQQHEWHWWRDGGRLIEVTGTGTSGPPDTMIALTAIARPHRFFDDLTALGIQLAARHSFADHHNFTTGELAPLLHQRHDIVVTAKDAVKLRHIWPTGRPLWVLQQQGEAENGLLAAITARIGG